MRRQGRECALQILYQLDVSGSLEPGIKESVIDKGLARFWGSFDSISGDGQEFAERLVKGVASDLATIDECISSASDNWSVARMAKVDRNVLRIAVYEIQRCADIPRPASINEALEIGKKFSNQEAARFINGILDQIHDTDGAN